MNLLLIEATERDGDRVVLDARRAEHLVRVLRVEPGQTVRAGVIGLGTGTATVVSVTPDAETRSGGHPKKARYVVELRLDEALQGRVPDPVETSARVDLIVGLPRPQVLHRVLQFAASMGVGQIDLVNAWRVEKSYFQSPSTRPERLRREVLLGAEQGATPFVPAATTHPRLLAFLDQLPPAEEDDRLRLVAHLEGAAPLETVVAPRLSAHPGRRVLLAIGPEGGWIDREIETFAERGFQRVWLGPWILRVEAAVVAALAQLDAISRSPRAC